MEKANDGNCQVFEGVQTFSTEIRVVILGQSVLRRLLNHTQKSHILCHSELGLAVWTMSIHKVKPF